MSESQPDVLHLFWQTLLLPPFVLLVLLPLPPPPLVFTQYPLCVYRLLTIPCVAILQIVYAVVLMTGKARELVRGYEEKGFFFGAREARGAAYMFGCRSVVRNHEYKHPRVHPCARQQPASAARVCCLNSGTHRLNNSRLSLLSLLAASAVDLHAKHTETQKVNLAPIKPSSWSFKIISWPLFLTCP